MTSPIKPLIAGNWKMNGLRSALGELDAMEQDFDETLRQRIDMLVCVPATLLAAAAARLRFVLVGGEDCHANSNGAHTGDISAEMLADAGARAIIVGHSERRTDHGETDADVRAKAQAVLRAALLPVICVGETLDERKGGRTLKVLQRQLAGSLPDLPEIVLAYEPVWAIGTGLTPTLADIGEAHEFLRARLVSRYGEAGRVIRILYGGSVKPANAGEILSTGDVNGALVGGASLKAADFMAICRAA